MLAYLKEAVWSEAWSAEGEKGKTACCFNHTLQGTLLSFDRCDAVATKGKATRAVCAGSAAGAGEMRNHVILSLRSVIWP